MDLPVKYLDADGKTTVVTESWPILDIHNTMHFLFDHARIDIPPSKLHEYWEQSKRFGEGWAQDIDPQDFQTTIPIGIYGDSARINTRFGYEHILALFCNVVLWRPRSVRHSRYLICAIPKQRLTFETLQKLLRRITWSANHCHFGFFLMKATSDKTYQGTS